MRTKKVRVGVRTVKCKMLPEKGAQNDERLARIARAKAFLDATREKFWNDASLIKNRHFNAECGVFVGPVRPFR